MAYRITIYLTQSIEKHDNYTIGGKAKYFMRAEKSGKVILEKSFSYNDDSVKRNGLYIYGLYDALQNLKGSGHTIDIVVDDRYIVMKAEQTAKAQFTNSKGEDIANYEAWKKFHKALKEKAKSWRISYMAKEDMKEELE